MCIISDEIKINIENVEKIFSGCSDLVKHHFIFQRGIEGDFPQEESIYVVYIDGLCDQRLVEANIINPLTWKWRDRKEKDFWEAVFSFESQSADVTQTETFEDVISGILKGDTGIFVSNSKKAMILSSKKLPVRGIEESSTEGGLRGPRDSFNESIRTSTALIRRRIKDEKLKVNGGIIGKRSKTDYAVMYIEDLSSEKLVKEVKNRLNEYEIDGIFDSGMAEHLMEKKWYRPFPIFQATTRPDKAAAAIIEGRVVVVFDNSPEVLIAPATINTLFQTADDYYNRWPVSTFARMIRYFAAIIAVLLPGLYIAITGYHREIIPDKLLFAIADARSKLSFPIVLEILIMELLFELLREAGIRLPSQMGNTIGVVGGLIVGQSAVEAGIVSTMALIVVALTAIASFAIPNEVFGSIFRLFKFFTIIASYVFGLFGFFMVSLLLLYVLASTDSFGVPYMSPIVSVGYDDECAYKDFVFREPISKLLFRPSWCNKNERRRLRKR